MKVTVLCLQKLRNENRLLKQRIENLEKVKNKEDFVIGTLSCCSL